MNPAQLLAHFNRISEAPEAVPRLRQLILDLAVRGKLVEQNPNDRPASALLRRIQSRRAQLVKKGSASNEDAPTPSDSNHAPFRIPAHWVWLPVNRVGALSGGMTPSKARTDFWDGRINWFSPKDVKSDALVESELKITPAAVAETGLQVYPPGCLFMVARSGILKRTFPVAVNRIEATVNQDLKVLRPFVVGMERYLQVMFRGMTDFILTALVKTGTTVQSLKYDDFEVALIPVPPLAEQHRIVAKVDELMALCDRLQAAQNEREFRRDRLVVASLNRLNESGAEGNQSFRDHARFQLSHLPRLTSRPEHIQKLRQTILNLAVHGSLTADWRREQAETDDASRIVAKLDSAHAAVGGHRQGNAAAATEGAHDLDVAGLPPSWRATELRAAVCPDRPITYGILMPGPDTLGGVPYVRVADFPDDRLNLETIRRTTKEIEERYARARLRTGDILVSIRGTVGRVCLVPKELDGANITQDTARLTLQDCLSREFVVLCLRAPVTQDRMRRCAKGVAVRGINIGDVRALQLPVPPLAEQHRIVAKVDELTDRCDRLEAQLTTAQTESRCLLEALLHLTLAAVA